MRVLLHINGGGNSSTLSVCFSWQYRDDLEALVYCLLELEMRSNGFLLPWNDTLTTNEEAAEGRWTTERRGECITLQVIRIALSPTTLIPDSSSLLIVLLFLACL